MADTEREVTREDLEAVAAKLGPAVESLTDGEREVFDLILERAATASDEVSGYALGAAASAWPKGGSRSVAWSNPLSAQLASGLKFEVDVIETKANPQDLK